MMQQSQELTVAAVAGLWVRFKDIILGRVEVIEQAISALLEGDLQDGLRQKAEQESHKLVGSIGSFGFKEASASPVSLTAPSAPGRFLDRHKPCTFQNWPRPFAGSWKVSRPDKYPSRQ